MNDKDPSSLLVHYLNKSAAEVGVFEDIVLKGALEDRCVVVPDMVSDLGALAAANIEVEVVTGPAQVGTALVLDDTHLTFPRHLAYSPLEKSSQGVVGAVGVAVASHHSFPMLVRTSFVCELDSRARKEETQKNSSSGIVQEVQLQRCWRKRHLAHNSKCSQTHWDGPHSIDLVDNPPYCPPAMIELVSVLKPAISPGRCWGSGETPTTRSRGQPPRLPIRKSEQPLYLPVDADGFPPYVDQYFLVDSGARSRPGLLVLLVGKITTQAKDSSVPISVFVSRKFIC